MLMGRIGVAWGGGGGSWGAWISGTGLKAGFGIIGVDSGMHEIYDGGVQVWVWVGILLYCEVLIGIYLMAEIPCSDIACFV